MSSSNVLKANVDFSLIIFGASGHLAQLKIFPALYFMALKGRFPKHFAIVGCARNEWDNDGFHKHCEDGFHRDVEAVNDGSL